MSNIPAIYVNSSKIMPYADLIVNGIKPIETRNNDTLGNFVGQQVLIIRSTSGKKAEVVGSAFISKKEFKTKAQLDKMRDLTMIPPGSTFDCYGMGKWCYHLVDPRRFEEAIPLEKYEVVRRCRSWAIVKDKETKQ